MTMTISRKAFIATVLLVVFVLSSVAVVYAEVIVGGVTQPQGTVMYSLNNTENGTWSATLTLSSSSDNWYSRLEFNGYRGSVTVTWMLQQETGFSSWTDVSGAVISTSIVLLGSVQNVYATSNGAYSSSNCDWSQYATGSGIYRVVVTIMA